VQVSRPETVARIALWRRIAAWVFPAITLAACLVFFVSLAAKASWLTMPLGGASVSTATILAIALLLLIVLAILAYAWLAERADRAAPKRDDRR
jgi:uncharacterized membrane protein (DUF485 family)